MITASPAGVKTLPAKWCDVRPCDRRAPVVVSSSQSEGATPRVSLGHCFNFSPCRGPWWAFVLAEGCATFEKRRLQSQRHQQCETTPRRPTSSVLVCNQQQPPSTPPPPSLPQERHCTNTLVEIHAREGQRRKPKALAHLCSSHTAEPVISPCPPHPSPTFRVLLPAEGLGGVSCQNQIAKSILTEARPYLGSVFKSILRPQTRRVRQKERQARPHMRKRDEACSDTVNLARRCIFVATCTTVYIRMMKMKMKDRRQKAQHQMEKRK